MLVSGSPTGVVSSALLAACVKVLFSYENLIQHRVSLGSLLLSSPSSPSFITELFEIPSWEKGRNGGVWRRLKQNPSQVQCYLPLAVHVLAEPRVAPSQQTGRSKMSFRETGENIQTLTFGLFFHSDNIKTCTS